MEPRKNRERRAMEKPRDAVMPGGFDRRSRAHEPPDACENQHTTDAVRIDREAEKGRRHVEADGSPREPGRSYVAGEASREVPRESAAERRHQHEEDDDCRIAADCESRQ